MIIHKDRTCHMAIGPSVLILTSRLPPTMGMNYDNYAYSGDSDTSNGNISCIHMIPRDLTKNCFSQFLHFGEQVFQTSISQKIDKNGTLQ